MEVSRRAVLEAGLAAPFATTVHAAAVQTHPAAGTSPADQRNTTLWHNKPANQWQEAHPVGNGRLGAMVFGGIKRERVQLNEDTLFSGGPYHNVNPAARDALPRVRELIFAGRHAEAEALAESALRAVPMREMSYQSLGDLFIDLLDVNDTAVTDYRRDLDLDAAVSRTRFTSNGVTYMREVLASVPDKLLAIAIDAGGAPLDLDCSLASGQRSGVTVEGGATLVLGGVNNTDFDNPGRLRFEVRVQVTAPGGSVSANGPVVQVRGARSVTILLAAATSFRSPADVSGDPSGIARARLASAAGKTFAEIRDVHSADHRRLFRRVALDLPATRAADLPTDQRAGHAIDRDDPSLAALFFQLGRYLLIASSRGSEPANLQGKWNNSNRPPWGSKYTININTEMNYWPADTANLPECIEPLVRMTEELAVSGTNTARAMYGARGWVAHHNTDLWRASGPVDHARTGVWPTGGAWLSVQLWDHWDFHRDRAYLARIYPLLRGASLFFLDTLVRDPASGHMVTNPSLSPENDHGHGSTLCAGPTLDMQLLRDLFDRTIESGRILRLDARLRPELAAMRARLAPNRIGRDGQLQEWLADWDADAVEPTHRHTSHLYGVYPSGQINLDDTPDLARAAHVSLDRRGSEATGWALAWRMCIWAHLREPDRAYRMLRMLLQTEPNAPGLLGIHPPFQIDCFFGGTAGIVEMLVQSRGELIDLLPALPRAWPAGRLSGVRVRGACTLDLLWSGGALEEVVLRPERTGARRVRVGGKVAQVALSAGEVTRLTAAQFS